jgi:hypothetical protein
MMKWLDTRSLRGAHFDANLRFQRKNFHAQASEIKLSAAALIFRTASAAFVYSWSWAAIL